MNNEQQELLNEAYEKYYATLIDSITFSERGKHFKSNGLEFNSGYPNYVHYSKEEFINKCKIDDEFAKKWCRIEPIKGSHYFIHNITIKRTGEI